MMFCEEKSTLKEKILAIVLFVTMLGSIFFVGTTIVTASSKKTLENAWENKLYTTSTVKNMYQTHTDESEFKNLDVVLFSELINYLEAESGSSLSKLSNYEKIVYTSLWISDYMDYDSTNINKYTYDVLKSKTGDCVGYADIFYSCMQILGIPCEIITMNANIKVESFKKLSLSQAIKTLNVGHAVNLVTINGGNYLVDCCWYDASQNADYILFGQNIFIQKYMYTNMGDMDYLNGYKLSSDIFLSLEKESLIQ